MIAPVSPSVSGTVASRLHQTQGQAASLVISRPRCHFCLLAFPRVGTWSSGKDTACRTSDRRVPAPGRSTECGRAQWASGSFDLGASETLSAYLNNRCDQLVLELSFSIID